ncbi:MAG: type II secretion system protein, partial [bacterium]|nr:type II secretion system protein [bacterium]
MINVKKNTKGYTMVEALVTLAFVGIIMGSAFSLVIHYGEVSEREAATIRMQQESRFMLSSLGSELKSAGSVVTALRFYFSNPIGDLKNEEPYYMGIFPIDNTTVAEAGQGTPDGVIIAIADPNTFNTISTTFSPSAGDDVEVVSTAVTGNEPWAIGDVGIVLGPKDYPGGSGDVVGYYVFSVTAVASDSLSVRSTAVYYSGLLDIQENNLQYKDTETKKGNTVTYPKGSPILRLSNFSIYLLRQVADSRALKMYLPGNIVSRDIRQLIRINDAKGFADPIVTGDYSVISENIWDMQISYKFEYTTLGTEQEYFSDAISASDSVTDFMQDLRDVKFKKLRLINVTFVVLSENLGGKGYWTLDIPDIYNETGYQLPPGKYRYKLLR